MDEGRRVEARESARGVFAISVAAQMTDTQVQNLRVYERAGLLTPDRTPGGTRLYSRDDIAVLLRVRDLLAEGLPLSGVARVMALQDEVARLRADNARLRRRLAGA